MPGAAKVIPWQRNLKGLFADYAGEQAFATREGVVLIGAELSRYRFLRVLTPLNIFGALAEGVGYKLSLSPAGQTAVQIIKALNGHLPLSNIIPKSEELLKYLNRLAHEDVEVEIGPNEARKKIKKLFAAYNDIRRVLHQEVVPHFLTAERQLANLIDMKVLRAGLTQECPECMHTSWYGLADIGPTFTYPRRSHVLSFPSFAPQEKKDWAYKMQEFYGEYDGKPENWIRDLFEYSDLEALGDFTQVEYLGMKPFDEAFRDKEIKKLEKRELAKQKRTENDRTNGASE